MDCTNRIECDDCIDWYNYSRPVSFTEPVEVKMFIIKLLQKYIIYDLANMVEKYIDNVKAYEVEYEIRHPFEHFMFISPYNWTSAYIFKIRAEYYLVDDNEKFDEENNKILLNRPIYLNFNTGVYDSVHEQFIHTSCAGCMCCMSWSNIPLYRNHYIDCAVHLVKYIEDSDDVFIHNFKDNLSIDIPKIDLDNLRGSIFIKFFYDPIEFAE